MVRATVQNTSEQNLSCFPDREKLHCQRSPKLEADLELGHRNGSNSLIRWRRSQAGSGSRALTRLPAGSTAPLAGCQRSVAGSKLGSKKVHRFLEVDKDPHQQRLYKEEKRIEGTKKRL